LKKGKWDGERDALKAIATPLPAVCRIGAVIQKAVVHPFLKNKLQSGAEAKKIGHAYKQPRITPPVPYLCCKIGKATSSHRACDMPIPPRKKEICMGVKP
jgi:hypothetical protein